MYNWIIKKVIWSMKISNRRYTTVRSKYLGFTYHHINVSKLRILLQEYISMEFLGKDFIVKVTKQWCVNDFRPKQNRAISKSVLC